MSDISFVSLPGVLTCAVGSAIRIFAHSLTKEASQVASAKRIENISDLKKERSKVPELVAVTGAAWARHPVKCELSDKEAVMIEACTDRHIVHTVDRRGARVRTTDTERLRSIRRETTWCLADSSQSTRLPVINSWSAKYIPWERREIYADEDRGVTQRALDMLAGMYVQGRTETEAFLPLHTQLTAIGELTSTSRQTAVASGSIRCRDHRVLALQAPQKGGPFILTKQSLPELIESLESRARRARLIANCFIGIGAAIITFRAVQATLRLIKRRRARKRAMERSQQRRLAAQQQRMQNPSTQEQTPCTAAAQSQATGVDGAREEGLCVVCIESRADSVFLCGHMCVCELCATGLQSCPICRRRSRPIRVFQT